MGRPSRERVTEALERLQETYTDFDVQQTSIGVSAEVHERAASDGVVDARLHIRNGRGDVLAADEGEGEDGAWTEPRVSYDPEDAPERRLREAVADETGVDCRIDELLDVAIVAVHDDENEDRDPVYLLEARFAGEYTGGAPTEKRVDWRDEVEDVRLAY